MWYTFVSPENLREKIVNIEQVAYAFVSVCATEEEKRNFSRTCTKPDNGKMMTGSTRENLLDKIEAIENALEKTGT